MKISYFVSRNGFFIVLFEVNPGCKIDTYFQIHSLFCCCFLAPKGTGLIKKKALL